MSVNYHLEALRAQQRFGWKSKDFAREYALARFCGGFSHEAAIREAKRSPYLKPWDIPPGL